MIEKLPIKTYFDNQDREVQEGSSIEFKINEIIEWINEQEAHNIKVKEDLDKYIKESNE